MKKNTNEERVYPNFVEANGIIEANRVNLENYTLLKSSESRDVYVFKKRSR